MSATPGQRRRSGAAGEGARRAPRQQRSAERVQRMLDACAELLDEIGYERTTTTLIASRAGVPIGSFYQFFPDKRAIVTALIQRYLETFLARVDKRLETPFKHWGEAVESGIDIVVDMLRTIPGFRVVGFGDAVDLHLLDPDQDNDEVLAARIAGLSRQTTLGTDPRFRAALTVAITAVDALLKRAFRIHPEGDQRLVDEAKVVVRLYLAHTFGEIVENAASGAKS